MMGRAKYPHIFVMVLFFLFLLVHKAFAIEIVSAEWLKENLNKKNLRVVFVPEKPDKGSYEVIPGSVIVHRYLDLGNLLKVPPTLYPSKEQFEALMSKLGIDKDTIVVAYDDKFGLFASRFLVIMEYYGHKSENLKLLNGGLINWKKLGYPLSNEVKKVNKTKYKVVKTNPILITWSDIYRDVVLGANKDVILLDARPSDEYQGKKIRSIRGGHIPGAINVTGADANDKETHLFKPVDEIKKMFAEKGIKEDKPIYVYCHSGDRAAHAYIILKYLLGFKNVKIYDGSWIEWSTLLPLPAENEIWRWEVTK